MEDNKENQQEVLQRLGEELEKLQTGQNEGRGVHFLRYVADDLKKGNEEMARADVCNQSDKFGNLEEIRLWLIDNLFKGARHPWETQEEFEKRHMK